MPGMMPQDQVLATIIVEGDPVDMGLPSDLPEPDYILPDASAETPNIRLGPGRRRTRRVAVEWRAPSTSD